LITIMFKCARPDCQILAKCSCSGCDREHYCGSDCQKLDWKIHKLMCPILKKLSYKLQPFREVDQIVNGIMASKKGSVIRVLEHLLSYAEYQFGTEVEGKIYREREDGEHMSNSDVDLRILNCFYMSNISSRKVKFYVVQKAICRAICIKFPPRIHGILDPSFCVENT
jgi:hypothetical protein